MAVAIRCFPQAVLIQLSAGRRAQQLPPAGWRQQALRSRICCRLLLLLARLLARLLLLGLVFAANCCCGCGVRCGMRRRRVLLGGVGGTASWREAVPAEGIPCQAGAIVEMLDVFQARLVELLQLSGAHGGGVGGGVRGRT